MTCMHLHMLTFYVLHDHAEVPACLKGTEHGDDKRILCKGKDVSFHKGLLDLVPEDQVLLVNLLHGKPLTCLEMAHQVNSAVGHRGIYMYTLFSLCGLCCL